VLCFSTSVKFPEVPEVSSKAAVSDIRRNFTDKAFSYSFRPQYDPGVNAASNRNEYQAYFLGSKGGRCRGMSTLPNTCADFLEIWEPQPPGTLRARAGL